MALLFRKQFFTQFIWLLILAPLTFNAAGQSPMDSLLSVWNDESQADTARLDAYSEYIRKGYIFRNPDTAFIMAQDLHDFAVEKNQAKYRAAALHLQALSFHVTSRYEQAIEYYNRVLEVRGEQDDKRGIAAVNNNLGMICEAMSDYDKAHEHYAIGIAIYEEFDDQLGIAKSLTKIGNIYTRQGLYKRAIDNYTRSLKINETLDSKDGISATLSSIGSIHYFQGDFQKAIEYYTKSLVIDEEEGDKEGISIMYSNIGACHKDLGDLDKAIDFHQRSLDIKREIGSRDGESASLHNIAIIYGEKGDHKKAIELLNQSLKLKLEVGVGLAISETINTLGNIYYNQGNYSKAIENGTKALSMAQEAGAAVPTQDAALLLFNAYKKVNEPGNALEMHELYIELKDSLLSEENQKEIIRQEYQYQFEKEALADSIKHEEAQKLIQADLDRQKAISAQQKLETKQEKLKANNAELTSWLLFGGLGIALLFGAFIFNRFRVTRKQNEIINTQKIKVEKQKKEVDHAYAELGEKNKEIMDSITYAKRIQSAILPPKKLVKEYLQNSFIHYKPKDIVAGDFFWMEPAGNAVLFAAADCTGHGVPGAMVSVICNNGLNRSVRELNLTDPGKILNQTRDLVISEFEKSEEEVKDGMDIALCKLDGTTLSYAGANNPLWIVRSGKQLETEPHPSGKIKMEEVDDFTIIEVKADKQPIGKYAELKPFTTHTLELQKGDTLYIFSDGYADQFGGEKGKKYKPGKFKKFLISIQQNSMEEQHDLIDKEFELWRGELEQIDDVCVIGVRV
jgi:tetratricopeptide (TPR) repeat protein